MKLKILRSRESVLEKKVKTNIGITQELSNLVVDGGFQRVQYLQQLDTLYELQSELANIKLEKSKLEAEKTIDNSKTPKESGTSTSVSERSRPISGIIFEPKARFQG